ncbi:MAG TPA: glycosyltransferase [Polyangia bacterium]|nr:glycosyltransferase [Polyangia bacterium]
MPRGRGERLDIAILGLSITSSWGNGHATTYRALLKALAARGHRIRFFERDVAWYARNRDLPRPPFADLCLYGSLDELNDEGADPISRADLVIVGSYVPDGIVVGSWVRRIARGLVAFYDIDTPVTLAALADGGAPYLLPAQIPDYDLYLSFTGGPVLERLEREFGARAARPLFCAFDPEIYRPDPRPPRWDLGYMGTYSADRQPALDELLLATARRMPDRPFAVAGPLYPQGLAWPDNVQRFEHVPPADHRGFYCSQRFTLNLTRADMIRAGHSPSVRLFEAAACGVPIISDDWPGLAALFEPGREILIARRAEEVAGYLTSLSPAEAARIGMRARQRVLAEHTAEDRAVQLESYVAELRENIRQRA